MLCCVPHDLLVQALAREGLAPCLIGLHPAAAGWSVVVMEHVVVRDVEPGDKGLVLGAVQRLHAGLPAR